MEKFHAHGKLLLSAEYAILHGAVGLALPLKYGQHLTLNKVPKASSNAKIFWRAFDKNNQEWFACTLKMNDLSLIDFTDKQKAETIKTLLNHCPTEGFDNTMDFYFETYLEFDNAWGWGTSSALVSLIAQSFDISPYPLYQATFKGSGYDLACATAEQPILFNLQQGKPQIKEISFKPSFTKDIYFVYLEKKQNSLQAIQNLPIPTTDFIIKINECTNQLVIHQNDLQSFCEIIEIHESLMAQYLGQETVKQKLFKDLDLTFKSLGAWGGDFVMVVGKRSEVEKLKQMGYSIVFTWDEIVL